MKYYWIPTGLPITKSILDDGNIERICTNYTKHSWLRQIELYRYTQVIYGSGTFSATYRSIKVGEAILHIHGTNHIIDTRTLYYTTPIKQLGIFFLIYCKKFIQWIGEITR